MRNDNPDTIAIEETQWVHTQVDDVFLPSVRVQLGWKEVEAAVEQGAVLPQQAHALWAGWASPMSGLRVAGAAPVARAFAPTQNDFPEPVVADADDGGFVARHGLWLGLLAGLALGAGGTWLALGG